MTILETKNEVAEDRSTKAEVKEKTIFGATIDLAKWLTTRPFKFWALSSLAIGSVGFVGVVFNSINAEDQPSQVGIDPGSDMILSQVTPASLGGVTPTTPKLEAVQRLQIGLEKYEELADYYQSQVFKDLYSIEANRLYNAAVKEEQSGKFKAVDPMGVIDLKSCPGQITSVRLCVLVRYALEGLNQYRLGIEGYKGEMSTGSLSKGNMDQAILGYTKYTAAMMAINPPPVTEPNYTRPLAALVVQLQSTYDIVQMIPPGNLKTPFLSRNQPAFIPKKTTPAKQIKKRNKVQTTDEK